MTPMSSTREAVSFDAPGIAAPFVQTRSPDSVSIYGARDSRLDQTRCLDFMYMSSRAYRPRSRPEVSGRSRAKIVAAVRELLEAGTFHESAVEEVAAKAGVSR